MNARASRMWVSAFNVPISGRTTSATSAKLVLLTIGARCER